MKIKCGIGNQLFQYAFGRKLAILNQSKLKLLLEDYDEVTLIHKIDPVKYRLDKFHINAEIVSNEATLPFTKKNKFQKSKLNKLLMRRMGLFSKIYRKFYYYYESLVNYKRNYIKQNNPFITTKKIFRISGNSYWDGYWGQYRYFNDIRGILLKELQLKNEFKSDKYKSCLQLIKDTQNSVSIHIRGLSGKISEHYKNYFGIPPLDYYYKAINKIIENLENPTFFIFTDNWEWTKENFKINYPMHFINDVGKEGDYLDSDYLELDLMSHCEHNIIANSTFSWWGAWLNENPEKIVIAPAKWYKNKKAQRWYEKGFLVPPEWIKV